MRSSHWCNSDERQGKHVNMKTNFTQNNRESTVFEGVLITTSKHYKITSETIRNHQAKGNFID